MADLERIVTPKGVLMWVSISGQGKLNFNKDGREFSACIILEGDAAKNFRETVKTHFEANKGKGKKLQSLGYKACNENGETTYKDGDEDVPYKLSETNYIIVRFKTGTTYKDDNNSPKIVEVRNAKNRPVELGQQLIGNGSIGRISGQMRYYENGANNGMSLFLDAVQLIKYVPYSNDPGFGEDDEEDGFEDFEPASSEFGSEDAVPEL